MIRKMSMLILVAVFSVLIITICIDNINGAAVPIPKARNNPGMLFYHEQRPLYYQQPSNYYPSAHQAMLYHYGGSPQKFASRRSTDVGLVGSASGGNEVAAFAAGENIGAGTFIQDEPIVNDPQPQSDVPLYDNVDGDSAYSVAEAYPAVAADDEQQQADDNEVYQQQDDDETVGIAPQQQQDPLPPSSQPAKKPKGPKELLPPADEIINNDDVEQQHQQQDEAVQPIVPPKKKIELDESEDDEYVPTNTKGRRPADNGNQWPLGAFFPMNFGSTSGGAIAVANSFSTGKGGTATSHATAYGSPATSSLRLKKQKNSKTT